MLCSLSAAADLSVHSPPHPLRSDTRTVGNDPNTHSLTFLHTVSTEGARRKETTGRPPTPGSASNEPTRHNERGPQEHRHTPSFTPAQTHLKTSFSGIRSAPDRRLPTSPAPRPRGSEPYPTVWVPAASVNASAGPPGSCGGRPRTFRAEALRRDCEGRLRTEGKGGGLPAAATSHALLGAGGPAARVRMTKQKSTPVQPWRLRQRA